MEVSTNRVWFRPLLERVGPYVEGFTALLSVLAVILILMAQFPAGSPLDLPDKIAGINCDKFVQAAIWVSFVVIFAMYGFTHRSLPVYARKFWLELVVCLTWIPFFNVPVISHLHSLMPLVMIGTLAHVVRAARWVMLRFARNPFVVLTTFTTLVMTVAAALLMKIEPETFTSFQESVFFVYMTALTLGGKFQANTLAGEIVVMAVATVGVGVVAVVIGTVREFMQRRIFGDNDTQVKILDEIQQQNLLLKQIREEQARQAEVYEKRLDALEKP